jgi:hypothetical protein
LVCLAGALPLSPGDARAAEANLADEEADRIALASVVPVSHRPLCARNDAIYRCLSRVVTDVCGEPLATPGPRGYGPADIASAYSLPSSGGHGKTIAIVDAYDYPAAESDLAVYRSAFGLPPCTTTNGCFKKVAYDGSSNYPPPDPMGCLGWNGEAALDLQMASATCPDCDLLLVEAAGPDTSLNTGVDTAAKLGVYAISNSYGGIEDGTIRAQETDFQHPGVLITAAAGDTAYGASYPATSAGVLAVGGTTLQRSTSSRGWAETGWRESSSGCSAYIAKPGWQDDRGCGMRMAVDVSAVADAATGLAAYCGVWRVLGGTSAAAPIVAGAFAVLGVPADPSLPWRHSKDFWDVTSGGNGQCTTPYFCQARVGYDGPTGWGTPNGALLLAEFAGDAGSADDAGADGSPHDASGGGECDGVPGTHDAGSGPMRASGAGCALAMGPLRGAMFGENGDQSLVGFLMAMAAIVGVRRVALARILDR